MKTCENAQFCEYHFLKSNNGFLKSNHAANLCTANNDSVSACKTLENHMDQGIQEWTK